MFKELKTSSERLQKILDNFKKNPNRKYTSKHILKITVEIKQIKDIFNDNIKKLVDADVNYSSINSCKDKFFKLYNQLDKILTDKILVITKPGDTTQEEIDICNTSDESEEDSDNKEHCNSILENPKMSKIDRFNAFKIVPKLDKEGNDLNSFLNILKEFEALTDNENEKSEFIKFIVKTKIDTSIIRKLEILGEIKNCTQLEINLLKVLKPKRTTLQIQSDLIHEKQNNKKVKEFSEKIESLVAELSSVRIGTITDENIKKMINTDVDETGLNAFKLGLNDSLKTVVYAANPETLAEAIQKARDFESSVSNGNSAKVYRFNTNNKKGYRQNKGNSNNYNNNNGNNFNKKRYNKNYGQNNNNRYNNNSRNFNQNSNSNDQRGNRNYNNSNRNNNQYNNYNNRNNSYNNNNRSNNNNNRNYSGQNNQNYRVNQMDSENGRNPEVQNQSASGNYQN